MNFEKLSRNKDYWNRYRVAIHPGCPIYILEQLANDPYRTVMAYVSYNQNCPLELKQAIESMMFIIW